LRKEGKEYRGYYKRPMNGVENNALGGRGGGEKEGEPGGASQSNSG